MIADIGGTTTDIAVVRNGMPPFGADGATVGGHRTMVEAVLMHTHGLGGDSEIRLADRAVGSQLEVGPRRVVPLSLIGEQHGDLLRNELRARLNDEILAYSMACSSSARHGLREPSSTATNRRSLTRSTSRSSRCRRRSRQASGASDATLVSRRFCDSPPSRPPMPAMCSATRPPTTPRSPG